MKILISILLLFSFSFAGIIKDATKGAAAYGAFKAGKAYYEMAKKEGLIGKIRIPYNKKMTQKQISEAKEKIADRIITKEEYEELKWNEKITKSRKEGVENFWAKEKQRLNDGELGTRNWTDQQKEEIIAGNRATFEGKTLEGHHQYSVDKYPNLIKDPDNIYPVTKQEHLQRWHGGNFKNQTDGEPLNPNHPEEF